MMNQESFNKLVDAIMSKGFDETTAAHFAALIGDTPTVDKDGHILVIKDGKIMARLNLSFLSDK